MSGISLQISGFADESSKSKLAEEQLAAVAAIGLRQYSLRFIDLGSGIKNAMDLTKKEIRQLNKMNQDFGLKVSTLGSPIGKVKLLDVEDGTKNRYVPFKKYLKQDVAKACDLAESLGTRLLRGFSFYHPKDEQPEGYVSQAIDQLGQIADECESRNLIFGLEVEANLIGQSGVLLQKIHKQINSKALTLIFDSGNLLTQGYTPDETFAEYQAMKKGLGWIHIKDYRPLNSTTKGGYIDEEALSDYRPVGRGSGVYERVLRDVLEDSQTFNRRMKKLGLPGMLLDLEPHVRGGGQFGGFSGPDGLGIAARSLCDLLNYLGLSHDLKGDDDLF